MELYVKNNRYGVEVEVYADNLEKVIDEDISVMRIHTWPKFSRDIPDATMDNFGVFMQDIIHERVEEYDSSDLIYSLFDKLPEKIKKEVKKKIRHEK